MQYFHTDSKEVIGRNIIGTTIKEVFPAQPKQLKLEDIYEFYVDDNLGIRNDKEINEDAHANFSTTIVSQEDNARIVWPVDGRLMRAREMVIIMGVKFLRGNMMLLPALCHLKLIDRTHMSVIFPILMIIRAMLATHYEFYYGN